MRKKIEGENVAGSTSYQSAKSKAPEYAKDPDKLNDLLDRAARKAISSKGPLTEVWNLLMTCLRLLRAYATGRYQDIPWGSLVSIIATVIYFVMPLDFIPDFLLGFGFIDDAALIGWILGSVKSDIDRFIEWESSHATLEQDDS